MKSLNSRLAVKIGILIAIEIVLITGSFSYIASFQNENILIGNSINIAGKNRFLTANVLLQTEYYSSGSAQKSTVIESLKNLESNIILVRDGGTQAGTGEIKALPLSLAGDWNQVYDNYSMFKNQVQEILSTNYGSNRVADRATLDDIGTKLIASSDSLVTKIAQFAKNNATQLLTLQVSLGGLNIGMHLLMLYLILKILRPIRQITRATSMIQSGNLDVSVPAAGDDELRGLAESFNSMVKSVKETSKTLEWEARKYEELYDGAPDLYRSVNLQGIIIKCNRAYVQHLGYETKNDVLGHSIFEHTAEEGTDNMHQCFAEWRSKGKVIEKEIWMKRKDGSIFPAALSATGVYDNKGRLLASNTVIIDESDRYKARQELERVNEELKRIDVLKNEFVSIASHELKTPIQPMIMYLELATEGIIDPKSAISTALKHAKRLQELANDMLDVTKIELGKMDLAFEQSKLNDLISECVDVFRPTLSSNVAFSLNLDSTFDTSTIRADRRRLEQAFSNIISNAIKFTQNGSIEIKSTFDNYRNIAEVEISDSGKGIPIDILPKLFGKFVTTNKSESNKKGTGLGLFIAKAIIEAHGGSITAFNNSQGGATFKLEIPLGKGKKELLVPPDQSFLFQSPN